MIAGRQPALESPMFSLLAAAPPRAVAPPDLSKVRPGQLRHRGQAIILLLDEAFLSQEAQSNAPAWHPGLLPNLLKLQDIVYQE